MANDEEKIKFQHDCANAVIPGEGCTTESGAKLISPNSVVIFNNEADFLDWGQSKTRNEVIGAPKHYSPFWYAPESVFNSIIFSSEDENVTAEDLYILSVNVSVDPVRSLLGLVWATGYQGLKFIRDHGGREYIHPDSEAYNKPVYFPEDRTKIEHIKTIPGGNGVSFIREEMLSIKYNNDMEKDVLMEKLDFANKMQAKDKSPVDYTTEHQFPYTNSQLEDTGHINKPLFMKTSSRYNYYIPPYEKLLSDYDKFSPSATTESEDGVISNSAYNNINENWEPILPDMYTFLFDKITGEELDEEFFNSGYSKQYQYYSDFLGTAGFIGADTINSYINLQGIFQVHLTLGNFIMNALINDNDKQWSYNSPISYQQNSYDWPGQTAKHQYLDIWTYSAQRILEEFGASHSKGARRLQIMFDLWKNKIFPASSVAEVNKINSRKYLLPMFNELEFSTDVNTNIADLFSDLQLDYSLLKTIDQGNRGKFTNHPTSLDWGLIDYYNTTPDVSAGFTMGWYTPARATSHQLEILPDGKTSDLQSISTDSFKLLSPGQSNWYSQFKDKGSDMYAELTNQSDLESDFSSDSTIMTGTEIKPVTDHAMMIDPDSMEVTLADGIGNLENKFFKTVFSTLLQKRLRDLVKNKTRSFASIASGDKAYSEVLCYKIEKYSINEDGQAHELLQTTFLQNSNDIDIIKYVDTQIKYNKKYIYKIFAWRAVFGTQLEYEPSLVKSDLGEGSPPDNSDGTNLLPQPGQGTTVYATLEELDKRLATVYRAASELLCADLTQRSYMEKVVRQQSWYKGGNDLGINAAFQDPSHPFKMSDADIVVAEGGYGNQANCCGPYFQYHTGQQSWATNCATPANYDSPGQFGSNATEFDVPNFEDYMLFQGALECCSHYGLEKDYGVDKFKTDFGDYEDHEIHKVIGEDGWTDYLTAHLGLRFTEQTALNPSFMDQVKSNTLSSIIARRVMFMKENGLKFGANSLMGDAMADGGELVDLAGASNYSGWQPGPFEGTDEGNSYSGQSSIISKKKQAETIIKTVGQTANYIAQGFNYQGASGFSEMIYVSVDQDATSIDVGPTLITKDFMDVSQAKPAGLTLPEGQQLWSWKSYENIRFWHALKFLRSHRFGKLSWWDTDHAPYAPGSDFDPHISSEDERKYEWLFQEKLSIYVAAVMDWASLYIESGNTPGTPIKTPPPKEPSSQIDDCPEGTILWQGTCIDDPGEQCPEGLTMTDMGCVDLGPQDKPPPPPDPPAPTPGSEFVDDNHGYVKITSKPQIKVIELPYFETTQLAAADYPPIYPNVDIIPYKGVNNKILINLSSNTGELKEPAAFVPAPANFKSGPVTEEIYSDKEAAWETWMLEYDDIVQSYVREYGVSVEDVEQSNTYFGVKDITFRNDDPANQFQILRLDERPLDIISFYGAASVILPTDGASSASFVDNLEPNKKYYYIFRSGDVHGHSSNPSPIYEVQLVDEEGAIYLLVKIMETGRDFFKIGTKAKSLKFTPGAIGMLGSTTEQIRELYRLKYSSSLKSKPEKSMRRYFYLKPALRHILLDEEATFGLKPGQATGGETKNVDTTQLDTVKLGVGDPALLNSNNKKYRIRLTSKSTGKKFDFNLKFNSEYIVEPEQKVIASEPVPKYTKWSDFSSEDDI